MSKYGMIFRDPVSNKMKIKLYSEPDGQLKGDGLCDYIRVSTTEFHHNNISYRYQFLYSLIRYVRLIVCIFSIKYSIGKTNTKHFMALTIKKSPGKFMKNVFLWKGWGGFAVQPAKINFPLILCVQIGFMTKISLKELQKTQMPNFV